MTRPRPSVGPALAGAVDLSALKQPPPTRGGAASAAPAGLDITEANLEAEVLARSNQKPVVVLLWTPRSEASAQLGDVLASLASADGDTWAFTTVNVDTAPRVAQVFGVQAVPTVVAVAGGQPISSFEGVQPPEQLRRWIDSLLSATAGKLGDGAADEAEQVDPALEKARELWDEAEFDDALAAYQAILDAQPNHAEAKDALRQISFLKRATVQPANAIAVADAAPGDVEAAFAAADVEVTQDLVVEAFTRLTALVRSTAGDERTAVRTRLIELFELFPQDDPRVVAGRRNLANALY
ncbi:tetratricopeptide repeat protein [Mycolicibacterium sp.]|uniref:tetratricopeptide repeat protein n=1 Tax=Mycolicibacterium sp. TaxID=2320850 RepID=UPI001A2161FA|nr:tetratricopeptide repeat protein [Mycolicibacterium sp.]MBJ7341745.1 tetratricopeptide repeat protein [Mycolicibacterium sp.]